MSSAGMEENKFSFNSNESSGRGIDNLMRTDSGSLRLSGRDLLDILNAFTSDPPLDGSGDLAFQDKNNTQHLNTIQPSANMFQNHPAMQKMGGSSKKFADLGRCAPVGGAFPTFYAPGYDDYGYGSPAMAPPPPHTEGFRAPDPPPPQASSAPNPMSFERLMLAGKKIAGFGGVAAQAEQQPVGRKKTPPLKKNQARTGYQHKPRKPHPVVEKARRDGINALIEELRYIVPEGGWKSSSSEFKKTTSLRDALDAIHGVEEKSVDKRTKRAVLLDAISSIENLKSHMKTLVEGGAAEESPKEEGADLQTAVSQDGKTFEVENMKKVEAHIELKASEGEAKANGMQVKISYFDRRGFLADECVAMRSLGLTIKSAELPKPNRNGFVEDTFEVETDGTHEMSEADVDAMTKDLVEALDETQSIYYQSQQAGEKRART